MVKTINGTPEKHIFRGMIADYDLQTGLCELIDNALDFWGESERRPGLKIEVKLDVSRQIILVKDNAGGVKEGDLRLLIAPGASRDRTHVNLIGIFGVGGKRAGVALGELVEIRTRHKRDTSYRIVLDNEWLGKETWEIEYDSCANITPGSTIVEISKLRQPFTETDVKRIRENLGEIYNWFIEQGCEIELDGSPIVRRSFDVWSYPPEYLPRRLSFAFQPDGARDLSVTMDAGLIGDRNELGENYGVYIYCNNRLIVKEMRTRDVGYFITSEAGVPHPDASLCRVIVRLEGNAELMPWNSSKSGVNIAHPSFTRLRSNIILLASYFSKLSRRLKTRWGDDVFPYDTGNIQAIDPVDAAGGHRLILPELPRVRRISYIDDIRQRNSKKMNTTPCTVGLVEAMGMVDVLSRQKIETRNRAALILLDSNFEIALKEFIVLRTDLFPLNTHGPRQLAGLFSQRTSVINAVKNQMPQLTDAMTQKAAFYYGLRNKLIHERATIPINDREIADYRLLVEKVLKMLFGLSFPRLS